MNRISPTLRLILPLLALAAGFLAPAVARAAQTEEKGVLYATINAPSGLSANDLQEACVATLMGRQWGVKEKGNGQVVGYLKHRTHEATVTLVYDEAKVSIYCVGYKIDKSTGVREKPEQPSGWLKNLQKDLVQNLNKSITHK